MIQIYFFLRYYKCCDWFGLIGDGLISLKFIRSDLFLCYLILWYVLIVYCIEICFFWFGLIRFEENPWFLWILLGSISYIINV